MSNTETKLFANIHKEWSEDDMTNHIISTPPHYEEYIYSISIIVPVVNRKIVYNWRINKRDLDNKEVLDNISKTAKKSLTEGMKKCLN